MLVIKPYVNYDSIGKEEEIWIQRTEHLSNKGTYDYRIRKPEGYESHRIYHTYDDGWMVLTEKALKIINLYNKKGV